MMSEMNRAASFEELSGEYFLIDKVVFNEENVVFEMLRKRCGREFKTFG